MHDLLRNNQRAKVASSFRIDFTIFTVALLDQGTKEELV